MKIYKTQKEVEKDIIISVNEYLKGVPMYKQGDVLVDEDGDKRKVLGVSGLVYHMSDYRDFEAGGGNYTIEELNKKYNKKALEERLEELEEVK